MKPRTIGPLGEEERASRAAFDSNRPRPIKGTNLAGTGTMPHTGTYLSKVADPNLPKPANVRYVPFRTTTSPERYANPNTATQNPRYLTGQGGIVRGVDSPDPKDRRPRSTTPKPGERFDAPCPYRGYQSVPATVKEVLTYRRGGVVLVLAYADREFTHTLREGATDKPITLPPPVGVQIIRNGKVYDPRKARTTQPTRTTIQTLTQSRGGTGYNGEVLN